MIYLPTVHEREWRSLVYDLEQLFRRAGVARTIDWPERPDPSAWLDPLLAEVHAVADQHHGGGEQVQ